MRRESPAENRQTGPDFFRKLFLYSPIGMVIGDRKGNILEVNPAMERILGYSAEEFKTLDAKAITHPDDYEKEISFIRSLFDEEAQGKQFRKRYIHRDGSVVQCILTASVICGCDGEPYRLIAHVQDYTEIENASRQLKKSEEAFDTLYRHNPDVLCIISEDMTIRSINRTATDCRPEEIIGRQAKDIVPQEKWEEFRHAAEKVLNDKETSGMEIQDRDGMTWFSRFVPLPDDNNGRRFLIISTDTTEVEQLRKIADRRDAQLRTVTMAMPDIPFVLNGEGRYVDVVTDKEHLLYDTVSRLKGRLLHDVLPVEVADEAVRIVRQTIETGQSQSMDYQLEVPAGLRWFEGRTALMPVEKTDEPLVVFVARDVTERVEAISALREATLFRDRILDTIPEIIYTYDFSTGKTRFANERLSEILGIEAAQMKDSDGHFIEGFLAENQTSQYSDHLRQMASADDGEVVSTEFVIQTGQRRLRLLCREAVLYRAADGRPREILGSALDVSEMRQTEEALRRSEERVRTFIETAEDIIYFLDLDGNLKMLNTSNERITGISLKAFESNPLVWREMVHPEDVRNTDAFLQRYPDGVPFYETEYRMRDKNGEYRTIWTRLTAARDEDGNILGYNCIDRDITEIRRAEEERQRLVARLNRMEKLESLSVFAGAIAHNFNNLLMSVLGNLELAALGIEAGSEEEAMIRDARGAARRAADLSRQMLVYVGQGQISQVDVDLATLLEEMIDAVQNRPPDPIPLALEIEKAPLNFSGDPLQVRQVVMNIIQNAREATSGSRDRITIRAGRGTFSEQDLARSYLRTSHAGGAYVWFEVADDGPGMDEETVGKIFDPFFSTKFTGRGLGLATVLGTVRGHNGAIFVESEPRKGTVFRVLFPALEDAVGDSEIDQACKQSKVSEGEKAILLVEDEVGVAKVCRRMLSRMGFRVDHAADGETAVAMFQELPDRYCCVLLDLVLPGIDGEDVLEQIREKSPSIPVILSSGYSREEIIRRFEDKNLDGVIHKPFEYGALVSEIRSAIKRTSDSNNPKG